MRTGSDIQLRHDRDRGRADAREGVTIRTYSGRTFWPLEPRATDIEIADIAHSLANLCRFNGQSRKLYTVAQHSVLVAEFVPPPLRGWGLLHDAAEAYLGDMVAPVKSADMRLGVAYREVEEPVMRAIAERFALSWPEPDEVATADRALLVAEFRHLMPLQEGDLEWLVDKHGQAYADAILPWSPGEAEAAFLGTYRRLQRAGELK
jgi:uncharacterized protein